MTTHAVHSTTDTDHPQSRPEPGHEIQIRSVGIGAPFRWLTAGVRDFRMAPGHSLLYGALFAGACLLTYGLTRGLPWFTLAFLTGLLLLGPYLAAGLYLASRQMEAGEPPSIRAALATIAERRTNMALYALFLGLVMAAWVRLSSLLFAVKFDLASPSIESYLGFLGGGLLSGGADAAVLVYFIGIGFLLAATVFATSVISIPLIVDRDSGPIAAIQASLRATRRNWLPLTLWAAVVTGLTVAGIVTYFAALIVIFPLLGYASWHAYKAMVE